MASNGNLHDEIAGLQCPKIQLSFAKDIAPLFTAMDVDHMKGVTGGSLDLSDYDDVKIYASAIYRKVASGGMPPPGSGEGPWSQQMVQTFGCWMQQNCPP